MGEQPKPYRSTYLDPDYRREPSGSKWCCRCQKEIKADQKHRYVHLIEGGLRVLHPEDEKIYQALVPLADDLGAHPIGRDCARKIGLEWSRPA